MKLMKDKETGISRGFAFITFVEVDAANKATTWCRHNHPRLDDKEIKVGLAERRRQHVTQGVSLSNDVNQKGSDTHTLYWEYKWSEDPDAKVYGPYETSLMLQWHMADYFRAGCWVRQAVESRVEQKGIVDHTKEPWADENHIQTTSLVGSYSSSSDDDEEKEHPSEAKRGRLDSAITKRDSGTIAMDNVRLRLSADTSSTVDHKKYPLSENEKIFGGDCGNYKGGISTEPSNVYDKKVEDKELESQEGINDSGHSNTWQNNSCATEGDGQYIQDPMSSWYQADRGGFKEKDILGRDSSSEDEDYDFYDMDQSTETTENEFVYISDIDFSMFP